MENSNPKKSKAFIITFILILILLVVGYYLFKNRDQIFGTKGSTSVNKIFSPLFGSSKDKELKVIEDPKINTTTPVVDTKPKITGTIITDANGNKIIMAEAGEMLKKGDVLYIAGFNKSNQPIVMKAIASDKNKSLVFGVAGEDMEKGKLGNIIIEGILTGIPTNRKEGTLWKTDNPLYLSDKVYGGMTKNPPVAPSLVVPVGSVIRVDAINGSIRIGKISNNTNISNKQKKDFNYLSYQLITSQNNPELIDFSMDDFRGYWGSIFDYDFSEFEFNNPDFPPIKPIDVPDYEGTCLNNATNYPTCTTKDGICLNGATNPDLCTDNIKDKCLNGATDYPICKTRNGQCVDTTMTNYPLCNTTGKCANSATNFPDCTVIGGKCINGATNPELCTLNIKDKCTNGATDYPTCKTKNGACIDKTMTNYPLCDTKITKENTCLNGATDYPTCKTKDGQCVDTTMTNYPLCNVKIDEPNKCLLFKENPLTFGPELQTELSELLRKFYLLAPKIKTEDDISSTYSEMAQYTSFINQIEDLTKQCKATVEKPGYLYPDVPGAYTRQAGNPWYQYNSRDSYLTDEQAKPFCYGTVKQGDDKGESCSQFTDGVTCVTRIINEYKVNGSLKDSWYPAAGVYATISEDLTGCQWINLRDYEQLLNIW